MRKKKDIGLHAAFQKCRFELIHHLLHSPNLTFWDYYRFQKMEEELKGCHFVGDDHVMAAVKHFMEVKGFCKRLNVCKRRKGLCRKMNMLGFLKVIPSALGHELINQPSHMQK